MVNEDFFEFKGKKIELNSLDKKGTDEKHLNRRINNYDKKISAQHEKVNANNRVCLFVIVILIFLPFIVTFLIIIL